MPQSPDLVAVLTGDQLMEALAAVEHERWSHWQRYVHENCEERADGSLIIPAHLVDRWTTQIETPYAQLEETEKNSDREQVRRYLPVIVAALADVDEPG